MIWTMVDKSFAEKYIHHRERRNVGKEYILIYYQN